MKKQATESYSTEKLFIKSTTCNLTELTLTVVGDLIVAGLVSSTQDAIYDGIEDIFIGGVNTGITVEHVASFSSIVTTNEGDDLLKEDTKYNIMVEAPNGKLYGIPRAKIPFIELDPKTGDYIFKDYGIADVGGYIAGQVTQNGKIFCVEQLGNRVLVVDTNDDTAYFLDIPDSLPTMSLMFNGNATIAQDGNIYYTPFNYNKIMIINPETDEVTLTDYGQPEKFVGGAKWVGSVLTPDNKIYFTSFSSEEVMIVDVDNQTISFTNYGIDMSQRNKWIQGSYVDGKIYCVAFESPNFLIIDTENQTASLNDFGLEIISENNGIALWNSGIRGIDGKLYHAPVFAGNFLIIDPSDNTVETKNYGINLDALRSFGRGTIISDGRIFIPPLDYTSVAIIYTNPNNENYGNFYLEPPQLKRPCIDQFYNTDFRKINFITDSFDLTFTGDLTGTATVNNTSNTKIDLSINPEFFITRISTGQNYPTKQVISKGTHIIIAHDSPSNPVALEPFVTLSVLTDESIGIRGFQLGVGTGGTVFPDINPYIRTTIDGNGDFTEWKALGYADNTDSNDNYNPRITFEQDMEGNTILTGLTDATITVTVNDDSHNHTLGTVSIDQDVIYSGGVDTIVGGDNSGLDVSLGSAQNTIDFEMQFTNEGIDFDSITDKPEGSVGTIYKNSYSDNSINIYDGTASSRTTYSLTRRYIANNMEEVDEIINTFGINDSSKFIFNISNNRAYTTSNYPNGTSLKLTDVIGVGRGILVSDIFYNQIYFINAVGDISRLTLGDVYGEEEANLAFEARARHINILIGSENTIDLKDYFNLSDYSDVQIYIKGRNPDNNTFFDARTITNYYINPDTGILTYKGTSNTTYQGVMSLVI